MIRPLVKANYNAVFNLQDSSGFYQPRVDVNLRDNINLSIFAWITTGKSSLECAEIVIKNGAIIAGYACIIDRSNGKSLIKDNIISQVKLNIPTFTKENLPKNLLSIKPVKPGSRNL